MTLQKITSKAHRHGLTTNTKKLASGQTGLFINLEIIENGDAKLAPRENIDAVLTYLDRYNIPWDYTGGYKTILIKQ